MEKDCNLFFYYDHLNMNYRRNSLFTCITGREFMVFEREFMMYMYNWAGIYGI